MAERRLGRGLESLLSEIPAVPVVIPTESITEDLTALQPGVPSSTHLSAPPVAPASTPTASIHPSLHQESRPESGSKSDASQNHSLKRDTQESIPSSTPILHPGADVIPSSQSIRYLPLVKVHPNPFQPRRDFDPRSIAELATSIREHGVLQPVLVRETNGRLELVAGERRFRAVESLKLETIPALMVSASDRDMVEMALIENIQRQDLNPIEKAVAFNELIERFGLTQEEVGERVGLDRSSVANFVRLLELPQSIRDRVSRGTLSMGHARALAGVIDESTMRRLAERVEREGLSVRRLENIISRSPSKPRRLRSGSSSAVKMFEEKLRERLQTKVSIAYGRKRGVISIEFYDNADFERILGILGV